MPATIHATGRLGRDPELRATTTSQKVEMNIAVDSGWGDNRTTKWYRVELWGKRSEYFANNLRKGDLVYFHGELSFREHDGNEYANVNATDIVPMAGPGSSNKSEPDRPQTSKKTAPVNDTAKETSKDDLPF